MAYTEDLRDAARRHQHAGVALQGGDRPHEARQHAAVAGYLYGLAAECALKALMRSSGMWPRAPSERADDPFYAHFPTLKTLLRDSVHGRLAERLRAHAVDGGLFRDWDIAMRYAPGREIPPERVESWRGQARALLAEMEAA